MTNYDKNLVAPLLRRKAHLEEVGADPAKLAELDHMLRMAGYPVDKESSLRGDERVEQEKPGVPRAEKEQTIMDDPETEREARKVAPKERSAKPDMETTAVPDHNKGTREVKTAEVLDKAEAKQDEKDVKQAEKNEKAELNKNDGVTSDFLSGSKKPEAKQTESKKDDSK